MKIILGNKKRYPPLLFFYEASINLIIKSFWMVQQQEKKIKLTHEHKCKNPE